MTQSGFSEGAAVVVKEIDAKNWEVEEPFTYTGQTQTFQIPVDTPTDFASVPRVFTWLLPRYGKYTLAAILHDYLWRSMAAEGKMDYIDADGTFRRAMRELGVPFVKRWIMWAAVRWGALVKPHGRRRWMRESWRVLLVTILALPLVLPPALVILVFLGIFYLIELIAWVPLRVARALRRDKSKAKVVNMPTLEWRT